MTKYRLRRPDGRLLGPFDQNQLFELKSKGHIRGNEDIQLYPAGSWIDIQQSPIYKELLDQNKTEMISVRTEVKEETFLIDLTKIKNQKKEIEIEKYQNEQIPPAEELTETIILKESENPKKAVKAKESEGTHTGNIIEQIKDELATEFITVEKTIINSEAQKELAKLRKAEAEEAERKAKEEEEKIRQEQEAKKFELAALDPTSNDLTNEKTQVFSLESPEILQLATQAETEIDEQLNKIVEEEKDQEESSYQENEDSENPEDDKKKKKKKKKKLIFAICGLAILYAVLFPDTGEKKKTFKRLEPQIVFPIPFDVADYQKAIAEYERGVIAFNSGTYEGLIRAGIAFKASYENNHESNYENIDNTVAPQKKQELTEQYKKSLEALGLMVRSYGEQFKHAPARIADVQTLFNIIQSKRPYLLKDPNAVIGLNLFYQAIRKPETANDIIDKYLKLNPQNVTQDLFATYVSSLLKQGRIDLARQFCLALQKAPLKNAYAYTAILEFLELNQESEKYRQVLDEALRKYPNKMSFILQKGEILISEKKFKDALVYLNKAEDLGLDNNIFSLAKLLELHGLIKAAQNKTKVATALLTKSLALKDSDELRIKLAALSSGDSKDEETSALINKSKAIKYLLEGQNFLEEKKYNLALSYAAKASEAVPGYVPAEVFLSKVQLRLGLAQEALSTLEKLAEKNNNSKLINLTLIDAYIETYKFNDAKKRIQTIASTEFRDSWEYASVNARLFYKMGDLLQAMSWLKTSIGLNPVNDADIFLMAQILLKKANFEMSRMYLNKCMEIDPMNPDYRIAYAKLLYETQDDRAAIGYLLSFKDSFGPNPKVLSEIAIFYYRAGKLKDFLDIKRQLEKEYSTDKNFYEFLIKSAQMDDRLLEIPQLVEKLLEIEPGSLEYMMIAGQSLFESGKLVEAATWFKRVRDKLPTYPKVLYFIAKIDFLSGDVEGAVKKIEENIKTNGESVDDLVFLAEIQLQKNNISEAEVFFKKAQKINANSFEAVVGLADVSIKMSNLDGALDLYTTAKKLRPEEAIIHKKMGDVYQLLGQGDLAIESYKRYLDMDPESPHKVQIQSYINKMQ